MILKKCKILSKFKTPLPLHNATGIKLIFPYADGRELEKSVVSILDADQGLIQFSLTDFEMQGLNVGEKQNFTAEVYFPTHKEVVLFAKSLNIIIENDRKVWK
jgi:hypothetical protein